MGRDPRKIWLDAFVRPAAFSPSKNESHGRRREKVQRSYRWISVLTSPCCPCCYRIFVDRESIIHSSLISFYRMSLSNSLREGFSVRKNQWIHRLETIKDFSAMICYSRCTIPSKRGLCPLFPSMKKHRLSGWRGICYRESAQEHGHLLHSVIKDGYMSKHS